MRPALLVAALLLVAPEALAQWSGDVIRPTAAGEIAGRELVDWRQSGTGAPTQLDRVCGGLAVEATLSGEPQRNFLDLAVENPTSSPAVVGLDEVMVTFSGGRVRRLLARGSELRVPPLQVVSVYLTFPDKTDFRGQQWLTIEAPVWMGTDRCSFELRFRRASLEPESALTTTVHRQWEVGVTIGPAFAVNGPFARVAPSAGLAADFNGATFPWPHHGFTLDVVLHGWGGDAARKAVPGVTGDKIELDDLSFLGGYAFRLYPRSWLTVSLEAAAGLGWMQIGGDNAVHARSNPFASAQGRVRLLIPIALVTYAGLVVDYDRFLGGHIDQTDLTGGSFGVSAAIGLGY